MNNSLIATADMINGRSLVLVQSFHTKKRGIERAKRYDIKILEVQQEKERKIKKAKREVDSLMKFYESK